MHSIQQFFFGYQRSPPSRRIRLIEGMSDTLADCLLDRFSGCVEGGCLIERDLFGYVLLCLFYQGGERDMRNVAMVLGLDPRTNKLHIISMCCFHVHTYHFLTDLSDSREAMRYYDSALTAPLPSPFLRTLSHLPEYDPTDITNRQYASPMRLLVCVATRAEDGSQPLSPYLPSEQHDRHLNTPLPKSHSAPPTPSLDKLDESMHRLKAGADQSDRFMELHLVTGGSSMPGWVA